MSDDPEDEEDSLRLTLGPPGSSRSSQSSQYHHLRQHQQLSQSKEEERYRPRRTPVRTPPPSSSSQSTLSFSHTVLQIPLHSDFFAIPWDFYLRFSFLVRVDIGMDAISLTPDYHLTAILVQKLVDLRFFKFWPWTVVVVVFVFYELRPLNAKPTS